MLVLGYSCICAVWLVFGFVLSDLVCIKCLKTIWSVISIHNFYTEGPEGL